MTILYITDAFAVWGGMERVLADKMNYLAEQCDYNVCLVTINQGDHTIPFPLCSCVKHVDLGVRMHQQYAYHGIQRYIKRSQLSSRLMTKLKDVIENVSPDVIVCVKLDFVGALKKVRSNIPLVVESHTMCNAERYECPGWFRRLYIRRLKHYIRTADAVVSLTDGDACDWRKYNKQVSVIPNIVHLNETTSYSDHTENRIAFVGRYTKQKDFDSLLRIWSIVYSRHSDWTLDVYSDVDIAASGIRVIKPVPNILEHYRISSMLVLTSIFEPFGLVLPEAMSCGLPVVAFDCPYGPADIITDGVDGFLVKNRDINEFADRVCQLIEDKELRIQMGQAAIKSAQRYRADIIMPKWKELFDQLCRKE